MAAVREFLDEYALRNRSQRAEAIAAEPVSTGDVRHDAFLAALAEYLSLHEGGATPAWATADQRFLERFWFISDVPGFRAIAIAASPASFRRRGIFVHPSALERVLLDRTEIVAPLTALGERLASKGIVGELCVVGGAAIALAYADRRSTRDIDAVFEPKVAIYEAAAEIAIELGLPDGWLNDAFKGFLVPDPDQRQVLDVPGLRCFLASPRILLALKVLAHRVGEDEDDVRLLAGVAGLHDASTILTVVEEVFGDKLDAAARFFVEEVFER